MHAACRSIHDTADASRFTGSWTISRLHSIGDLGAESVRPPSLRQRTGALGSDRHFV
jgi:hypothetical protein